MQVTVASNGELFCCGCNCKAGGNKEENKIANINDENVACLHELPNIIKISFMLFDYLADDACFEPSSLCRRHDGNPSCRNEDMVIVKDSTVTLTSVALASRNYLKYS